MSSLPRKFIAALALAGITIVVFWPTTRHAFLTYDDPEYVTQNTFVRAGLTWSGLAWAATTHHAGNWHPVTWLSHMLDVQLFGVTPGWHHFINVLLHGGNSALLFLLLARATGAFWKSLIAGGLFALHPLHVESVAWVAERKDVLSTFFFLLSLTAYVRYVGATRVTESVETSNAVEKPAQRLKHKGNWLFYTLSLTAFALGLMSKPMLVTTPFVLLLLDYWPLGRLPEDRLSILKRLLIEKTPFFALAAVSCLFTLSAQTAGGAVSSLAGLSIGDRIENAIVSYIKYLSKAVWPNDLAVFYPHPALHYPESIQWGLAAVCASAVALAGITALCIGLRKTAPWLGVGWLWFLGTLVPVIGIVQVGSQAMADRYMYVPLVGLLFMGIWGLAAALQHFPLARPAIGWALSLVTLMSCLVVTARQLRFWTNDLSLFEQAAAVTRDNSIAHYSLGLALQQKGKDEQAIDEFSSALKCAPWDVQARTSLGVSFSRMGRTNEALQVLQSALADAPGHVMARLTLADTLWRCGDTTNALSEYAELARTQPSSDFVRYRYGSALAGLQHLKEAETELQQAIRLNPRLVEARVELARVWGTWGRFAEAETQLQEAAHERKTAEIYFQLGMLSEVQGRRGEAIDHYNQCVALKPDFIPVLNELAWLLATSPEDTLRNGPHAVEFAERARDLSKGMEARYWGTLGAAYAENGRFPDAVAAAQKAIELAKAGGLTEIAIANSKLLEEYKNAKAHRE